MSRVQHFERLSGRLLYAAIPIGCLCIGARGGEEASQPEELPVCKAHEVSVVLPEVKGQLHAVAFSPDGEWLVGVGSYPLPKSGTRRWLAEHIFWNTTDWEATRDVSLLPDRGPDPAGGPLHAAFVGEGTWLAVLTNDHQLQLFENRATRRRRERRWTLQMSVDLAAVYTNKSTNRLRVRYYSWAPMRSSPNHAWLAVPIHDVDRRAGALGRSQSAVGLVELWEVAAAQTSGATKAGPELLRRHTLKHAFVKPTDLLSLTFAAGGRRVVTLSQGDLVLRIWSSETGELLQSCAVDRGLPAEVVTSEGLDDVHRRDILDGDLAVSPSGTTVAVAVGGLLRLFDLEGFRWKSFHRSVSAQPSSGSVVLAFHPSGDWLLQIANGQLVLFSVSPLEPRLVVQLDRVRVWHPEMLAVAPNGKTVITGGYQPRRWSFDSLLATAGVQTP
ncbi:MAG: WD40 repeat domain-containing protein [Planctomycetes bacterium]|nr:WD40 repeat domain-containing protein [Planctomycetota bacterium]